MIFSRINAAAAVTISMLFSTGAAMIFFGRPKSKSDRRRARQEMAGFAERFGKISKPIVLPNSGGELLRLKQHLAQKRVALQEKIQDLKKYKAAKDKMETKVAAAAEELELAPEDNTALFLASVKADDDLDAAKD